LARNFLFALFISVVPALMPVVGLKVLHLSSSNQIQRHTQRQFMTVESSTISSSSATWTGEALARDLLHQT
jgi:uncharacterized membrane protein